MIQLHSLWNYSILGNTPDLIKIGCLFLFISWLLFLGKIWWTSRKVIKQISILAQKADQHGNCDENERRNGLNLERLDQLKTNFKDLEGFSLSWWRRIDDQIEKYVSPEEVDGWFLTENPRAALPFDVVVGRNFYTSFWGAIPGILTGGGLALTFIAILLALWKVHYDKSNAIDPITGIDSLINGLSGKFLSSIVALILSILFTFREKSIVRKLRNNYEVLIDKISSAVPYMSTSRILMDMHRFSAKQTISLHNLSSELVDRLTNAMNERVVPGLAAGMSSGFADTLQVEFRPTMERMAASLDGLQSAIVQLESQKQDSVTGEFEKMAQSLEQSITQALGKMGEQFHDALLGSARNEFGQAQDSLESTRQLLSEMNSQFAGMQVAFNAIVSKAEETTTGQLNTGREQTEALTAVMNGLMLKLQESADHNLNTMQTQLTNVVTDLTNKVGGLSKDMMDATTAMASRTEQTTANMLEKTGEQSKTADEQLRKLLANIEARSDDFKQASAALLDAKNFMSNLLTQNANALAQMAEASNNVKLYSAGLAGHSDELKQIRDHHHIVATNLSKAASDLKSSFERHDSLLQRYDGTILEYKNVFGHLDEDITKIMNATSNGLSHYNQSVESNFDSIVNAASQLVPKVGNLLSGQIDELGGQLEELSAIIKMSMEKVNGRTI